MDKTIFSPLWWQCPICGEKVIFTNELLGELFDENTGEAFFSVKEDGGVIFHTVFCSKCGASWTISVSGLEKDFLIDEYLQN